MVRKNERVKSRFLTRIHDRRLFLPQVGRCGVALGKPPRRDRRFRLRRSSSANVSDQSRCPSSLWLGSGGEQLFHTLDIGWHINAQSVVIGLDDADAKAVLEPAKLLEAFDSFEFTRGERRKFN